MTIFSKITKGDLREFIKLCKTQVSDIDENTAYELAINAIRYYKGDDSVRDKLRILQELETKWYESLDANNPDYSIYDNKNFLSDIWACWIIYSRKYLLSLKSEKSLFGKSIIADIGSIKTIADLGCGFGYTTAGLKELFPDADVFGTQFKDSCQWKVATELGKKHNFSIEEHPFIGKQIDLIFASEYFEHIENTTEHISDIINECKPKYLIIANSFNTKSVGHFRKYKLMDDWIDEKNISRIFNKVIKDKGFKKVKTKLWNNKPAYWRRNET